MDTRVSPRQSDTLDTATENQILSHPQLNIACYELGLSLSEIWPKLSDASQGLNQHEEARRKAKLFLVIKFLQGRSQLLTATPSHPTISPVTLESLSTRRVEHIKNSAAHLSRVKANKKSLKLHAEARKRQIRTQLQERERKASAEKLALVEQTRAKAELIEAKLHNAFQTRKRQNAQRTVKIRRHNWSTPSRASVTPKRHPPRSVTP